MSEAGIARQRFERHPGVVLVTIDRPPVNALTQASYLALEQAFLELDDDPSTAAIVLSAKGRRAFCAGADIRDFARFDLHNGPAFQRVRTRAFTAMHECTVPIVGAINGPALGAGLIIASLCDVLLASTQATFGLPEVDIGVLGGARHLMRLLPGQCVRHMALTGRRLGADRMLALGALNEVLPPEALLDAALELAGELAAKDAVVVRMTKSALTMAEDLDLHHGHRLEQVHMLALSGREETDENG